MSKETKNRTWPLWIAAACLFGLGCQPQQTVTKERTSAEQPPAFEELLASLRSADTLYVYEGLPHQFEERELLEQEQKRTDTVQFGGYPFYTPRILMDPTGATKLLEQINLPETFYIRRGEPLDCGFHPDYAVSWMDGTSERFVLLCFGCHQARFLAGLDKAESYEKRDINNVKHLQEIMKAYQSKRPSR